MGYPYRFDELVIVDLPSEDRHELYRTDEEPRSVETAGGRVTYRYHSMTDLSSYTSGSFDMVYSGESIEHIKRRQAEHVFAEVHRVLKPGGVFALDTPNATMTRLQQEPYIDPDHEYEYTHEELSAMLRGNGFVIERAQGINYGGDSLARGTFDAGELATKRGLFDDIDACYLLAYVCRRPHRPTAHGGRPGGLEGRQPRRRARTRPALRTPVPARWGPLRQCQPGRHPPPIGYVLADCS